VNRQYIHKNSKDLTDTHGTLLGWCSPDLWTGHVRWVALLFLSCLEVGWSIGEAIVGMMGQTEIPLDTKRTVVWD